MGDGRKLQSLVLLIPWSAARPSIMIMPRHRCHSECRMIGVQCRSLAVNIKFARGCLTTCFGILFGASDWSRCTKSCKRQLARRRDMPRKLPKHSSHLCTDQDIVSTPTHHCRILPTCMQLRDSCGNRYMTIHPQRASLAEGFDEKH